MAKLVSAFIIGLALFAQASTAQKTTPLTSDELNRRTVERRPVREFWSVTVYSLETSSFFLNTPNLTLGSLDKGLTKNADGSVDLYFGPKPPAGKESNWLYTQAGQKWFPWFRVYGPEKAILDKSWKLPDIERVN